MFIEEELQGYSIIDKLEKTAGTRFETLSVGSEEQSRTQEQFVRSRAQLFTE